MSMSYIIDLNGIAGIITRVTYTRCRIAFVNPSVNRFVILSYFMNLTCIAGMIILYATCGMTNLNGIAVLII